MDNRVIVQCNGKEIGTARNAELQRLPPSGNIRVVNYTLDLIDLIPLDEKDTILTQNLILQLLEKKVEESCSYNSNDFSLGRRAFAEELYHELQTHLNSLQKRGALKEEENNG